MSEIYDNEKCRQAVAKACDMFSEMGLNLYEVYRVATSLKETAKSRVLMSVDDEEQRAEIERVFELMWML